jgi:uroporphyrinogen-III synthase
MTIVRVGAGAALPDLLTVEARDLLARADRVVLDDESLRPLAESVASSPARVEGTTDGWWRHATGLVVHLVGGEGLAVPSAGPAADGQAAERLPAPDDIVPGTAPDVAERVLAVLGGAGADLDAVRPLRGLTVVVTRAAAQGEELSRPLRRLGARVVELPTIRLEPPADGGAALTGALADPSRYDWVVVTSVNGARAVLDRSPDARRLAGVRLAAIGPATAAVLEGVHLPPDLVPPRFVAESLLEVFPPGPGRILLARAAVARDVLPEGLRRAGWEVDVVEAYRTVAGEPSPDALEAAAGADVACFTAPSTFERFLALAGAERLAPVVACIGPVTAASVEAAGFSPTLVAPIHTIAGLVDALAEWVRSRRRRPQHR